MFTQQHNTYSIGIPEYILMCGCSCFKFSACSSFDLFAAQNLLSIGFGCSKMLTNPFCAMLFGRFGVQKLAEDMGTGNRD